MAHFESMASESPSALASSSVRAAQIVRDIRLMQSFRRSVLRRRVVMIDVDRRRMAHNVKGLAGGMEMREFLREVIRAIKEGPAIYFAPIGAAIRAARSR